MAESLKFLEFEKPLAKIYEKITELEKLTAEGQIDLDSEIKKLSKKADELRQEIFSNLTPLQIVQLARHPQRPTTYDYIDYIFSDFVELHGDRLYSDDAALIGGLAKFKGRPVVVIGHQKGKNTKENLYRNFGMANPEGYSKALRLMKLAEKFGAPIIIFIDTPGAYPGIGGEERGVAEAIARNMKEMSRLTTPIICIITGEGGSGGAIGIGVGDRIMILQYAYYSVITPEACSSILFRDTSKTDLATSNLKLTAKDLKKLKVVDQIIPEPFTGAHHDPQQTAQNVAEAIDQSLKELTKIPTADLLQNRYEHFRNLGQFTEKAARQVSNNEKKEKNSNSGNHKKSS